MITHSQLVHPNIIPLFGVFYENTDAAPMMVLPYAEKGSLSDVKVIADIEFARIVCPAAYSLRTNLFTSVCLPVYRHNPRSNISPLKKTANIPW